MRIAQKSFNIICLALAVILLAGIAESFSKQNSSESAKNTQILADCLNIIKKDYVEEPREKTLVYGALRGMLASLDQHSQFLDPEEYADLKVETTGQFGGLGIEITIKDGLLTVVTPIADTPAWKAELKPQDRIVKIDGAITKNMTMGEAVKKLRGQPGSQVTLTILRESSASFFDVKLNRDIIKIKDVKEARLLEAGIAYIRLTEFGEKTSGELSAALQRLKQEGMRGLILDLRNNPGGLLNTAIKVTEKFIPAKKLIVSTKGREASNNARYFSNEGSPLLDIPMVVIVNEGSASGSEIVAGALKDYNRAIVLGTKTFGKGSVQTVIPLSDGSAMKLTTSLYFTPSGSSIHNKGIVPEVEVQDVPAEQPAQNSDPLSGTKAKNIFDKLEPDSGQLPDDNAKDYKSDNKITRAVDILKALLIYGTFRD